MKKELKDIKAAPLIRFKTEGFRAVDSADIVVNGITVVAGENGSGKSTLSKLLYYLYKTVANYDSLVSEELLRQLRNVFQFLDALEHELHIPSKDRNIRDEIHKELSSLRRSIKQDTLSNITLENFLSFIKKTEDIYLSQLANYKDNELVFSRSKRFRYIIEDILNQKEIKPDKDDTFGFKKIREFIESRFKEAFGKIKSRPTSLFIEALKDVFAEGELPKVFEVFEFDSEIVSLKKSNLSIPYSIQNAIYIDSPIMLGHNETDIEYWDDLNELLTKNGKHSSQSLSKLISESIINGDISIDEEHSTSYNTDFFYKRSDGSVFDLLDCATGIKAFGIIQLLLKNGTLNDKTLLIIDEPESNLHPQWIIEYARLIVLLNKEIGVKFFIASHNPDMVSALKYISMKEGVSNNLNFYLAEKKENTFSYKYNLLEQNIDPIFKSFNIALDRINQYGA